MTIPGYEYPRRRRDFQQTVNVVAQAYINGRSGPAWQRFPDQPVRFITDILKQHRGDTWRGWRIILKAAFGQELTPDELPFFYEVSGGRSPPNQRVKELWC